MKQFFTVFNFEIKNYFKSKAYIGITVALVAVIAVVLFFPQIKSLFVSGDSEDSAELSTAYFSGIEESDVEYMNEILSSAFSDYKIELCSYSSEELEKKVKDGDCEFAVLIESGTSYKYFVNDVGLYDMNTEILSEILQSKLMYDKMTELGLTGEQASEIMSQEITFETVNIGTDQSQSFFYTYIFIFALYMAVLLYGQFVSTGVATEKSSRAMELLITSAKTKNLMFGKILGAGCAGLIQLVVIFGSAFVLFNINKESWADNRIINSIFNMPISIILYIILFFVLGFFIYAFLYGAVGSLVSKVEDLNTAATPITFLFIIAFILVMFSLGSGDVDSPLIVAASYIPFTSPMAMFVRITMGDVAAIEIIASVVILIASTVGIGFLSAKIYRLGILMYGKPVNLISAIKMAAKKN